MKNLHLYILYFGVFLFLNACTSNSSESTEKLELVPYYYKNKWNIFATDGKWGFMDREKNVVVHASYEYVQRFYRGDSLFNFTFGSVGDSEYELIDNNGNILEKDIIKWDDVFFQKDTKEWFYRYKNENIPLEGKVPKKYIGNKIILHDSIKNIDYLASTLPINEIEIAKNHERINKLYAIKVENIKHSKNTIFYENKLAIIKYKNILYEITPSKITEVVQYLGKDDKFLTIQNPTSFIYIDKAISQKMPSMATYSNLGFFIDYKNDSSFIYNEEGNYFDKHKGKVKDVIQYKNKTLPVFYKKNADGLFMNLPNQKKTIKNIKTIHSYHNVSHIELENSVLVVTKDTIINNLSHSFREQTLFGFIKNDIPDSIYLIPYGRKISIAVPTYMEVVISDTLTEKQPLSYSIATVEDNIFFYYSFQNKEFNYYNYTTKELKTIKGVVKTAGFSEGFAFLKKENEMLIINQKGKITNSFEIITNVNSPKFKNGLALITEAVGENTHYIDKEGNKYSIFD